MAKKQLIAKGLVTLSLLTQNFAWAQQSAPKVERPPQYVIFAFDGSYTNGVWEYSRQYSQEQKRKGIDTRFTYFINPVYFIAPQDKEIYDAPGYRLGYSGGKQQKIRNRGSAIGWGDDRQDISTRVDHMNEAFREGHEIGSHAVGHFDGGYKECDINSLTRKCERDSRGNIVWKWDLRWSESEWKSEFEQFYKMVDSVFSLNNIRPKHAKGHLWRDDIKGFRAPVLGVSEGLWPNLPKFGIKYDTSKVNFENYWPAKNEYGTWNFPLAEILEPGGARRWISMDYNFCVRDSARVLKEDPSVMNITKPDGTKANKARDCLNAVPASQKAKIKSNMMELYTTYFNRNYHGNRAPLHIGHHFSQWMSGAYYETFYEFASAVCNKPEVKCVTYAELMKYMETKTPTELAAFKKGEFAKLPRPKSATAARHLDMAIQMTADSTGLQFAVSGRDAKMAGLKMSVNVGDTNRDIKSRMELSEVRSAVQEGEDAIVRVALTDRFDKEVATASFKVEKVGTAYEQVSEENLEDAWLQGHLNGAHGEQMDFSQGH